MRSRINCGRLNMRIARDGTWFYHGTPIGRKEMVRLFSTILERRDDGSYWLASPAEEGIIDVEDAPFVAIELFAEGTGRDQQLSFRTNVDDIVTLDAQHPLRVTDAQDAAVHDDSRGAAPYIFVRKGLEARPSRAVYYELVGLGVEERRDGAPEYGVWSAGLFFPLGRLPQD
ncbi:MAG TPA: DUF1285 domain-containing protein [Magnetospirillaceae bacterium]|jgi:hypothetical protein